MRTAWYSPSLNQVVHEIVPKNYVSPSAGWSWCGAYFHGGQIHIKSRVVTCVWCIARRDRVFESTII